MRKRRAALLLGHLSSYKRQLLTQSRNARNGNLVVTKFQVFSCLVIRLVSVTDRYHFVASLRRCVNCFFSVKSKAMRTLRVNQKTVSSFQLIDFTL
jgi:hypothetical protein